MKYEAINSCLVKNNSIFVSFEIEYFPISLYRALIFREINIVYK